MPASLRQSFRQKKNSCIDSNNELYESDADFAPSGGQIEAGYSLTRPENKFLISVNNKTRKSYRKKKGNYLDITKGKILDDKQVNQEMIVQAFKKVSKRLGKVTQRVAQEILK